MQAPASLHTERLFLRRPHPSDAEAIFRRYASDPTVTRYMSWPTHGSVEETRGFIAWAEADWAQWPAGSYLVFLRDNPAHLLGGTGIHFSTSGQALTGYVFAQDAWGKGYATETLRAMATLAPAIGLRRLQVVCHVDHHASARVIEKCGFCFEGILPAHTLFPNLAPGVALDVRSYALDFC